MDNLAIKVQSGPSNYFNHINAIENINNFFTKEEINNSIWIYGEKAAKAASKYLPIDLSDNNINSFCIKGHCSYEIVDDLKSKSNNAPAVIGIGGGTIMDIAKATAAKLNKPFIAIPTIAATCAAWTPLSVWYSKEGKALGYEIFKQSNFLVLVEPRIIINAPIKYLKAGFADTLAKQYESEILVQGLDKIPYTAHIAVNIAKDINKTLLSEGIEAIANIDNPKYQQSIINVIDTIIAGGGLIGGLGERFTRVAAAHAIHNGISSIERSKDILHGTKVAYGILVQTALLNNDILLKEQIEQFKKLGLPTKLADLNLDYSNKNELSLIINTTLKPSESIHLLPFKVDEIILEKAISKVEQFNTTDKE
jgi:uncharacterized oxidoreductase